MKMKEVRQAYDKWQCIEKEDDDIGMLIFSKNDLLNFAKYYHQSKVNNVVLDDVSERYLLIEWLNGNPMIDGSIYFDSKEDCLTYWQDLPKTDLFDITHTICRINNVR